MGFVALKPIEMADGMRMPGELIPEAASWPHLNSWAKRGFVALVAEGCEEQFVSELRAGRSPQALAPMAKPYHLNCAARLLSYGTAPVLAQTESSPSAPDEVPADAVPPTEVIAAAVPEEAAVPEAAPAEVIEPISTKQHGRKKG